MRPKRAVIASGCPEAQAGRTAGISRQKGSGDCDAPYGYTGSDGYTSSYRYADTYGYAGSLGNTDSCGYADRRIRRSGSLDAQ